MPPLRLATRASGQARTQAAAVVDRLAAAGQRAELVFIETAGDRTQSDNVPLHSIGGQGVFVKEVQRAVLDGRADLAVHSAKDLPTEPVDPLMIAAFTERRTASDALIGRGLHDLESGATVATGSVRRRAQLADHRPDLQFVELRGNIETRLAKIPPDGAIVMAIAALEVLGLTGHVAQALDVERFVPAVGQGCVAVECRRDDSEVAAALASIDHRPTRNQVVVERAYLAELGSGCSLPIGAHVTGGVLVTFLAGADQVVRESIELVGDLDADRAAAAAAARRHLAAVGPPTES